MIKTVNHIKKHQGFIKYLKNTSWLLAEKVLRMVVGLLVGIWVVRYLGPEQFGMLSYVTAFVGLFLPLGKLGFDGIVSRDIAKNESDVDELISTTILFKFLGSFLIVLLTSSYMYFTKEQDIYFYLSICLSMVFVVKAYEIMEFYFRAKVKAKYISIANSVGIVVSSLLKVLFILFKFSLIYFAVANLFEAIVAILLLYLYFRNEPNKISFLKIKFSKGLELIKESWPLIFSGFFALVYLNIDQVMIEELLGSCKVAQYSTAVRISSAFYVIVPILSWSLQTPIVNAKKYNEKIYYHRLKMLALLTSILAYAITIPFAIFSNELIVFLFGDKYTEAGSIFMVHIFSVIFIFNWLAKGLFITNESLFVFSLLTNIIGALINVVLNYIFIMKYGIIAAAWTTLISYAVAYTFSGLLYSKTRMISIIQVKALFLIDIKYFIVNIKNRNF